MKYGTCRDFNDAFALALENMGYYPAANYARILPASAHLMWTAVGKKPDFFRTISKDIRESDISRLQYAFTQGLEAVLNLYHTNGKHKKRC